MDKNKKDNYERMTEELSMLTAPKAPSRMFKIFKVAKSGDIIKEERDKPDPEELWESFWYEGEICCLFADTNVGKSILAVQIAIDIAKQGRRVVYCDFELSNKQFQLRYTDGMTHQVYPMPDNFYRAQIDMSLAGEGNFEQMVCESIEQTVLGTGARVIIIDNISFLSINNEKGDDALSVMKFLLEMRNKYHLSILVLAHTPKRPPNQPISGNDMAGSKKLMNFMDSAFSVGRSIKGVGVRYLKQLKIRSGSMKYGSSVLEAEIVKEKGFLHFKFATITPEEEHLAKAKSRSNFEERRTLILDLKKQGLQPADIAKQTGISIASVYRALGD